MQIGWLELILRLGCIFLNINVYGESIPASSNQMQLYLNGRKIGVAPCEEYSIRCYKAKMLQIFHHVANYTQSEHLFYVYGI